KVRASPVFTKLIWLTLIQSPSQKSQIHPATHLLLHKRATTCDDPAGRNHHHQCTNPTLLRPRPKRRDSSRRQYSLWRATSRYRRHHLRPPRTLPAGHLASKTLRRLAEPHQRIHRDATAHLLPGHHGQRHLP